MEIPMPSAPAAQLQSSDALLKLGAVTLIVRDLEGVGRYYEEVIGLHRMGTEHDTVRLGDGHAVLLTLLQRNVAPKPPGSAGLFHTAFLLPTRADLGRWLR